MATDLSLLFEQAVSDSKNLTEKPSNDSLLQLYAFYKQATEGDVSADPPSNPFDFVAKAKFEAWSAQTGTTRESAMQKYTDLIAKLKG